MSKISPLEYITPWTPEAEPVMVASQWFETEYCTLTVEEGDDQSQGMLGWFLAQGWVNYETATTTLQRNVTGGGTKEIVSRLHYFRRYKLQSQRVLQSMIGQFTKAYNEGRQVNNRRYDEIVALHDVMLSRSEDSIAASVEDSARYDDIIDAIIDGLPSNFQEYSDKVDGLLDDYGDSHRERINTQFDNQKAAMQQSSVSRGLYNSTVFSTLDTGLEESRAKALNDLEDKLIERRLSAIDRVQQVRDSISGRMENASARLMELKRARRFDAADFRNRILTAMLAFMERREDEYPGIGQLAELASGLGYAEGGSSAPPVM